MPGWGKGKGEEGEEREALWGNKKGRKKWAEHDIGGEEILDGGKKLRMVENRCWIYGKMGV